MSKQFSVTASSDGFTAKAYSGDRCVMLAFNLEDHLTAGLAGFAISRCAQGTAEPVWLGNRLGFEGDYTAASGANKGKFFNSSVNPFQKFWWVDFTPEDSFGLYEYEATVMRFKSDHSRELEADQKVTLSIEVGPFKNGAIEVAFTRGFLSSQAYADKFKNKALQPTHGNWDFDTAPYQQQWAWLGAHARQAIIDFLTECYQDADATLDAFVYDLNEPDIIRAIESFGERLRSIADDSKLHTDETAAGQAYARIRDAAGDGNARRGHFGRYQHNKVFIKKMNGKAVKVLTGSTNFSITGLYVIANHVLVVDDPAFAAAYEYVFELAFRSGVKAGAFAADPVSQSELEFTNPSLPKIMVSFAPHKHPPFSLKSLAHEIDAANSSVIFAVMELKSSSGDIVKKLGALHSDQEIFSYGISDNIDPDDNTINGTTVYTPRTKGGELVYSKENPETFPEPFSQERQVSGAAAHVVHHKFVVIDFNDTDPVVFCGSSNLAEGGEEHNGDNLIAIYDRAVATAFAIEGIRLVAHSAFAAALKNKGDTGKPLRLKFNEEKWWAPYYADGSIKQN